MIAVSPDLIFLLCRQQPSPQEHDPTLSARYIPSRRLLSSLSSGTKSFEVEEFSGAGEIVALIALDSLPIAEPW